MEGFLDMNYSQTSPHKCLEESLKQIMLDHEIIFKKQVHELHRLYAIQKSLMKGDAKYTRCDFLPMKRTFTEIHSVGATRFVLANSLQEDQDFFSKIQQRPLDLRLSTGNFCNDDVFGDEEVNLSLSIGSSTNKRSRIAGKTWKNTILYPSSRDIIDLEESTETGSNEDAISDFHVDQSSRNSTYHWKRYLSHGMTESLMIQSDMHQDHLKKDTSLGMPESLVNGAVHQDWSSSNQGSNKWHGVKQTIAMDLDLNKNRPSESSFHSNEPLGPYPSCGSSSGESCSQIDKPIEVSTSSTATLKQPKSQTGAKDIQPKACTIDLESMPELSSDLTEEKGMDILEVREQKEKEDSDYTIQKAALSLISISLQRTSSSNEDSETKSGSNETENNDEIKKKTIPRSSSIDSYESLVLKLEETSIDEECVTSKAFETDELDQKENGIKLRRGRRLKDFQKDILPTLSSLARHEILEDINILEGVIRSREYKRLHKAKTGNGENWFTPVRSKRSKVNYVGRRWCSRKKK